MRHEAKLIGIVALTASVALLTGCNQPGSASNASIEANQVAAADLHPCDVTDTQLTLEDCNAAREWASKAKKGTAAFNAPTWMLDGIGREVTLAIGTVPPKPEPAPAQTAAPAASRGPTAQAPAPPSSRGLTPQAAPSETAADDATPHETVVQATRDKHDVVIDYHPFVGSKMSADLVGDGFTITAVSKRVQPVSDGSVTVWQWRVTPHGTGRRTLLMTTAIIMVDSQKGENPLKPTTTLRPVMVYVGPATVWDVIVQAPTWLKALGTLLGAIGVFIGAWRGFLLLLRRKGGDRRAQPASRAPPPANDEAGQAPKPHRTRRKTSRR